MTKTVKEILDRISSDLELSEKMGLGTPSTIILKHDEYKILRLAQLNNLDTFLALNHQLITEKMGMTVYGIPVKVDYDSR